jgi:hypothetical protein
MDMISASASEYVENTEDSSSEDTDGASMSQEESPANDSATIDNLI